MRGGGGGRGSLLEIQLGGRCIVWDAELPCRGLHGINPWVVSIGMVFGLGQSVVCVSPPPTCVPPASKNQVLDRCCDGARSLPHATGSGAGGVGGVWDGVGHKKKQPLGRQ